MKVTKDQVLKLCEEIHRLKRMGDHHITSQDWHQGTITSCELANSVMNNMTSVEDLMDERTQIAVTLLQDELAYGRTRMRPEEQQLTDAVNKSVYLADALLSQLAQTEEEKDRDKIKSEDSRKYWRGKNNALQARIDALETCIGAAWGIIANVSDWSEQSPVWQEAAAEWRDRYVITRHASMTEGGAR